MDPLFGEAIGHLAPVDPLIDFPEVTPVRVLLVAGDWRGIEALLGELRHDPERSIHLMDVALTGLNPDAVRDALERWASARPNDWRPHYVLGVHALGRVDHSAASGDDPNAIREQGRWLRTAGYHLSTAARLDRDQIPVWHLLVRLAGELRVPVESRVRRYDEIHQRRAGLAVSVLNAIVALGPRYDGDSQELFTFARYIVRDAPRFDPVHGAIPLAHLEATSKASPVDVALYFKRGEVVDELLKAFAAWFDGRPVLRSLTDRWTANVFGAAFVWADHYDEARAAIRKIGDRPDEAAWSRLSLPPRDAYQLVRHRLGILPSSKGPKVSFRGTVRDPGDLADAVALSALPAGSSASRP